MKGTLQLRGCISNVLQLLMVSETARWGEVTLRGLLLLGGLYAWPLQQKFNGERDHALSIVGLLPNWLLFDPRLFACCKLLFVVFGALWFVGLLIPWSGWIATVSFTALMSLFVESEYYTTHQCHVLGVLLWVFCAWHHFCRRELQAAPAKTQLLSRPVMPRWVYALGLYSLCLTYTFSGLTKIVRNGFGWANGTSLQLWVLSFGDPTSVLGQLVLSDRRIAEAAQGTTLLFEALAWTALVFPRLRRLVGGGLLGFHLGSELIFNYRFYANMFAIAAFLLAYPSWAAWPLPQERRAPTPRGLPGVA
jgi:hypothetical protein